MANFSKNSQKNIARFVLRNLPRHKLFVLGTIDPLGRPWVVCLNLSYDKDINIIWKSLKNTEHSKHIRKNPNVSICIFSHDEKIGDFGFYTKAIAKEVNGEKQLEHCLAVRYAGKSVPDTKEFLDKSPMRIYTAKISQAWINDDRHIKCKIDLKVLREEAKKFRK